MAPITTYITHKAYLVLTIVFLCIWVLGFTIFWTRRKFQPILGRTLKFAIVHNLIHLLTFVVHAIILLAPPIPCSWWFFVLSTTLYIGASINITRRISLLFRLEIQKNARELMTTRTLSWFTIRRHWLKPRPLLLMNVVMFCTQMGFNLIFLFGDPIMYKQNCDNIPFSESWGLYGSIIVPLSMLLVVAVVGQILNKKIANHPQDNFGIGPALRLQSLSALTLAIELGLGLALVLPTALTPAIGAGFFHHGIVSNFVHNWYPVLETFKKKLILLQVDLKEIPLEELMSSERAMEHFGQFLARELALENLQFYTESSTYLHHLTQMNLSKITSTTTQSISRSQGVSKSLLPRLEYVSSRGEKSKKASNPKTSAVVAAGDVGLQDLDNNLHDPSPLAEHRSVAAQLNEYYNGDGISNDNVDDNQVEAEDPTTTIVVVGGEKNNEGNGKISDLTLNPALSVSATVAVAVVTVHGSSNGDGSSDDNGDKPSNQQQQQQQQQPPSSEDKKNQPIPVKKLTPAGGSPSSSSSSSAAAAAASAAAASTTHQHNKEHALAVAKSLAFTSDGTGNGSQHHHGKRKKDKDFDPLKETVRLFDQYINEGAPFQINISSGTRRDTKQRLETILQDADAAGGLTLEIAGELKNVFAKAREEILKLMVHDSYPRFLMSSEFAQLNQHGLLSRAQLFMGNDSSPDTAGDKLDAAAAAQLSVSR